MKKNNKIIFKDILPMTLVTIAGGLSMIAITVMAFDDTVGIFFPKNKAVVIASDLLFLIGGCFCISLIEKFVKRDYEFASKVTREYLQHIMKDNPEIKKFENVLSNPCAMRGIATMISNSLNKIEQECVLSVVKEMLQTINDKTSGEYTKKVAIKQACRSIIKIIKGHAETHPEFIQELSDAMEYANKTYVVPIQQKTR